MRRSYVSNRYFIIYIMNIALRRFLHNHGNIATNILCLLGIFYHMSLFDIVINFFMCISFIVQRSIQVPVRHHEVHSRNIEFPLVTDTHTSYIVSDIRFK